MARYLQRYCAKNDTIGSFGSVGWATLHDSPTRFEPGKRLVACWTVSFKLWALEAFASAVAGRHGLLPLVPPAVAMSELWFWSQGLFFGAGGRPADRVRQDAGAGGRRCCRPGARYHSFDVQVAVSSVEQLRADRFLLVMGEAHFALNPVGIGVFQSQHPEPGELVGYAELDVPEDRVVLAMAP